MIKYIVLLSVIALVKSVPANDIIPHPDTVDEKAETFFNEFEDLPGVDTGYSEEHFDLDDHDLMEDREQIGSKTVIIKHAIWFNDEGVDANKVLYDADFSMPNFTEFYVGSYFAKKMHKSLKAYATRSGKYCFIRFELQAWARNTDFDLRKNRVFYFECSKLQAGKAFWRLMNEDCPYPPIKPCPPVVEEVCYMHTRKAEDFIEHSFEAYGKGNSNAILHCYVEVLTVTKKGSVETMCTRDALVKGWEALTQNKLDVLMHSADHVADNDKEGQTFTYNEETTKTKFKAK